MKINKRPYLSLQFVLTVVISSIFLLVNAISFALGFVILNLSPGYSITPLPGAGPIPKLTTILSILVAGAVVAAVISRKPIQMLGELMEAINKVAKGDYTVRLSWKEFGTIQEIIGVGQSFNTMTEELGKVELLKRDFINDFSHEFKTPIASISGFARVLKHDDLTASEKEEYLDIIIEESGRLTELATNVLNLSKVEKQAIVSNQTTINVSEELRQTVILLSEKMDAKELDVEFQADEVDFYGNRELLKQVWINLLDNAIKFSPQKGRLSCMVEEKGEEILVSVANEGIPIPAEDVSRVFDQFYQAESSHSTKGNGLGLTIAQKIISLHQGKIQLTENREDCIKFMITLPNTKAIHL